MGTWGFGSFENDIASDWIWDLKPAKKSLLGKLKEPFTTPATAINALLGSDIYLECSECDEAVAAAECVAAAIGNPMENPPEEIGKWIASLKMTPPDNEIVNRAIKAIEKVRNDEQSESRALWSESTDDGLPDPQWLESIDNLLNRLRNQTS